MADKDLGELFGPMGRHPGTIAGWAAMIGTALSLALVAGVAVWGYKLAMRDVNGIPVIKALAGPMRVAPKDPGGEQMAYQGLAVNQVAAAGEAGEISEEVTLAPTAPVLLEQDLPQAVLTAPPMTDINEATDDAVMQALDDVASAEGGEAEIADAAPAVAPADLVPASAGGVARSPRPAPRPATLVRSAAQPLATVQNASLVISAPDATEADEAPKVVEIAPDLLPVGARLVQLGAYDSADAARDAWDQTATRFADVMAGKERVIQEASSGGKTFYRLRVAGFEDLADARRFCSTLVADPSKPLCVPVAIR